ncbi:MAG TPA: spherulation-specific family 4 protein [Nitrosopumilaceae archaeon]|nr:spherulation-specific family 4 protein [Nitrosopumilaceae archaeon]
MKTLYFGIIGGIFIMVIFISNTALTAQQDSNNQSTSSTTTGDLATRIGGNAIGIYYPMYDLSELPQVLAAKKAFSIVPFDVNINPESGPGTEPSISWADAITQLKNTGDVVTGYVPTGYGTRTVANVEDMISAYHQFYPKLDGIMFDEVSSSSSEFTFYQTISNYARSLGFSYIRANPGNSIHQGDVQLFDHIAIYESSRYPDESTLQSRTFYPQYSKDVVGFGVTIHSQPTYNSTWLHMATKYLKWVYITDQTEPNPYAVFPSYFNQYLTDLSSLDMALTINDLINNVKSMNLQEDETTIFDSKLQVAIKSLNSNNNEAKNQLNAFIHEVNAQTGKKITQDQANQLIRSARNILNSIH